MEGIITNLTDDLRRREPKPTPAPPSVRIRKGVSASEFSNALDRLNKATMLSISGNPVTVKRRAAGPRFIDWWAWIGLALILTIVGALT